MGIIQDKYNIKLDFESQDIRVPIDDRIFNRYDLDHKSFVENYIIIAGSQLFTGRKTIYRFKEGDFYLSVYYEEPKIGILFVRDKKQFSDEYMEKLRIYCGFKKIKLVVVHLYSQRKDKYTHVVNSNELEINISGKDSLEVLDEKIRNLMEGLLELYSNKYLYSHKNELYQGLDTQLCYRLGILLSIIPRKSDVYKNGERIG